MTTSLIKFQSYMNTIVNFNDKDFLERQINCENYIYTYSLEENFGFKFKFLNRFLNSKCHIVSDLYIFKKICQYYQFDEKLILRILDNYFKAMLDNKLLESIDVIDYSYFSKLFKNEQLFLNISKANSSDVNKPVCPIISDISIDFFKFPYSSDSELCIVFNLPLNLKDRIIVTFKKSILGKASFTVSKPVKSISARRNRKSHMLIEYDEIDKHIFKYIINNMRDIIKKHHKISKKEVPTDIDKIKKEMILLDIIKY